MGVLLQSHNSIIIKEDNSQKAIITAEPAGGLVISAEKQR